MKLEKYHVGNTLTRDELFELDKVTPESLVIVKIGNRYAPCRGVSIKKKKNGEVVLVINS